MSAPPARKTPETATHLAPNLTRTGQHVWRLTLADTQNPAAPAQPEPRSRQHLTQTAGNEEPKRAAQPPVSRRQTSGDTSPAPTMDTDLAQASIRLVNGNGRRGMAGRYAAHLRSAGLNVTQLANAPTFNVVQSKIVYRTGNRARAEAMAKIFPVPASIEPVAVARADVVVTLGQDMWAIDPNFGDGNAIKHQRAATQKKGQRS